METEFIGDTPNSRIFTLRYIPQYPALSQVGSGYVVNIYPFTCDPDFLNSFVAFIRADVIPLMRQIDFISYQGNDLRNDLRKEILSTPSLMTQEILIEARDCLAAFLSTFWFLVEEQKIRWSQLSQQNDEIDRWESGLYIRGGIVELKVVENELFGKLGDDFIPNFPEADYGIGNVPMLPLSVLEARHWMDTSDVNQNIRNLMTNAGWYPNNKFDLAELRLWAKLYLDAYMNAKGLFRCPGIDMYENILEIKKVVNFEHGFHYFNFPNRKRFYELLDGKNVLLVTPFAAEIKQLFESGKIWKLWTDLEIPKFNLEVIQSPMSIFPNRPNSSWIESFRTLQETIQLSFSQNKHSLFFASAGSYGLPICNFVYATYDIASVYTGNYINYLFGVRQNATEDEFYSDKRDVANWATSGLGSIPGLSRVDDGRYVFTGKD